MLHKKNFNFQMKIKNTEIRRKTKTKKKRRQQENCIIHFNSLTYVTLIHIDKVNAENVK